MAEPTRPRAPRAPYRRLLSRATEIPAEADAVRMTIRIKASDYERMRQVAAATRRPMQDIYREALTKHLDDIMPSTA